MPMRIAPGFVAYVADAGAGVPEILKGAQGKVYSANDTALSVPLTCRDIATEEAIPDPVSNMDGYIPGFKVSISDTAPGVIWKSGEYTVFQPFLGVPGKDGSNVIPTNTAIIEAISPGGAAEASLKATIMEGTQSVSADVDTTGLTNSKGIIQAAIYAAPNGGDVILPKGDVLFQGAASVNNWTSATDQTPKSIRIVGRGTRIICDGTFSKAFDLVGGFEAPIAATSVTVVSVRADNASFELYQPGVEIATTAAPAWKRGEVVRLFADNPIADARPEAGGLAARVGQDLTVHSVAADKVILLGTLVDSYTTNIRVARFKPGVRVEVVGDVTFTQSDARYADNTQTAYVSLTGLVGPQVDFKVERANTAMLVTSGCYEAEARIEVGYARDNPATGSLGYGVLDKNSTRSTLRDLRGRNLRHLYTDDMARIAAGTGSPHSYGRTFEAKIIDCHGDGASNAPFDTHHGSYGTQFTNCTATNSVTGFQLRGRNAQMTGCRGENNGNDVRVFTESEGGETGGHFIDLHSIRPRGHSLKVDIHPTGHPLAGVRSTAPVARIRGLSVMEAGDGILTSKNGHAVFEGGLAYRPGAKLAAGSAAFLSEGNSQITVYGGASLDYSANTEGSGLKVIELSTSDSSTFEAFGSLVVRDYAGANLTTLMANDNKAIVRVDGIRCIGSALATISSRAASGSYFQWDNPPAYGDSSATLILAGAAIATPGDAIQKLGATTEPNLLLVLQPSGTDRTLAPLPAALKRGQRLLVVNGSSSGIITVANGVTGNTSLRGAVDKTIPAGQSLELIWTNEARWRQTLPIG